MSPEAAKARHLQSSELDAEFSPAEAARTRLEEALAGLETTITARLEEGERQLQALRAAQAEADQSTAIEQWQNASRVLEEQVAALQEDNTRAHAELQQLREDLLALNQQNATLKAELKNALAEVQVVEKIVEIEKIVEVEAAGEDHSAELAQIRGELAQLQQELATLSTSHHTLKSAAGEAGKALDAAIAEIGALLKE